MVCCGPEALDAELVVEELQDLALELCAQVGKQLFDDAESHHVVDEDFCECCCLHVGEWVCVDEFGEVVDQYHDVLVSLFRGCHGACEVGCEQLSWSCW